MAQLISDNTEQSRPSEDLKAMRVGAVDDPLATKVRIVHISDTHLRHNNYRHIIPAGDILVHSGDFTTWSRKEHLKLSTSDTYRQDIADVNDFFSKMPHKAKIFVAGNHEKALSSQTFSQIQQDLQTSVHYLQDSAVKVMGVKFYGSPCNSHVRMGFGCRPEKMNNKWDLIPDDTDVLVTHVPPLNILDLAATSRGPGDATCDTCGKIHSGYGHWGCPFLRSTIFDRVKPAVHMFGHVHDEPGTKFQDGVLFCNAAMDLSPRPIVVDYYMLTNKLGPEPSSKTKRKKGWLRHLFSHS